MCCRAQYGRLFASGAFSRSGLCFGSTHRIEIAITTNSRHVPSALFKIIILGVLIRASAYFEFPSTIAVDPYYHVGFIQFVLDHGYIPAHAAPYDASRVPESADFAHVGRGFNVNHRTQRV